MKRMAVLMNQGKISKATFDEFAKATPNTKALPERVKKSKTSSKPKSGLRKPKARGYSK